MEVRLPGLAGPRKRFGIHVSKHEQSTRPIVDRYRSDQSGSVKSRREWLNCIVFRGLGGDDRAPGMHDLARKVLVAR